MILMREYYIRNNEKIMKIVTMKIKALNHLKTHYKNNSIMAEIGRISVKS